MSKQVKVSDEVHSLLMAARLEGETASDVIARVLGRAPANSVTTDEKTELPGTEVDMSDWVDGEAPECCINSIVNKFAPGDICEDWVRLEYTDKNGLRRQSWFNKRTGEYEFSDRWNKIKAEYTYQ